MLGEWIDGLSDAERDRIIEGQEWLSGDMIWGERRCLISHAYALTENGFGAPELAVPRAALTLDYICDIACRFDVLVNRFDFDRIVRACKLRAARSNVITLTEPARVP